MVAAVVVSLNAMVTVHGAAWWNVVIVAAGSLLAGLVIGSYIGAPIGADATVCGPTVLAGVIQPAFALLSLAPFGWALRERLERERSAVSAAADVCCRPLFPARPGPSGGAHEAQVWTVQVGLLCLAPLHDAGT